MLEAVKQKQIEKDLTNKEMAKLFAPMHEITWAKIKSKTIPFSDKYKRKAINIWPDLISIFLSENAE